eukprot:6970954-Alexandrium_andersonii.AAC.1
MSASLVGSEMCIRDRVCRSHPLAWSPPVTRPCLSALVRQRAGGAQPESCLLYTSDAADDM